MENDKYVIGMDFGTLSGRAVLARCADGKILASAERKYRHGVMEAFLPDGITRLKEGTALQDPEDYPEVLEALVGELVRESGADPADIIGLAIDFTSCTVLPVDAEGRPLCSLPAYRNRPHAYVKLWKHHGAQKEAEEIGGKLGEEISSEILYPKVLEMLREDPEVYQASHRILEAADWLTWLLTGSEKRSVSMAGYKAWWSAENGFPQEGFLAKLDERLDGSKLFGEVCPVGKSIGLLNEVWARKLGLSPRTAVAAGVIDSHAGAPGSHILGKDQLMLVLGTSSVIMAFSEKPFRGMGVYGTVRDGVIPGYYGLESGVAAVGDALEWFVKSCVPASYYEQAGAKGLDIYQYLTELAGKVDPGKSRVLALDWFNGNKTPYVNTDLTGSLAGLTLQTKPEEIFRALIEATAFDARQILEIMERSEAEVRIREVTASGGIAGKNPLILQIYADILQRPVKVAAEPQTAALGSAIYAALAAGKAAGGYDSYREAVNAMSRVHDTVYMPREEYREIYNSKYGNYQRYGAWMDTFHRREGGDGL